MHYTTAALLAGSRALNDYYGEAQERWQRLVPTDDVNPVDVEKLATRLHSEQLWFEHHCGGRHLGQEIMVVSGIARFYNMQTGFETTEEKAKAVALALLRSDCSLEVKALAKQTAESYSLLLP